MITDGSHIGPYEIKARLGQGGFGAVFRGERQDIGRQVAIKFLQPQHYDSPNLLARFLIEARAANQVRHPGIVQVTDLQQGPDGVPCIIMEYLEGETLSARMERTSRVLPVEEALRIAQLLASALAFAHAQGVIHRDLKPSNIMIVPDPDMPSRERTKIMDFGIAKLRPAESSQLSSNAATEVETASRQLLGTPCYMAPEQTLQEKAELTGKVDVYALGILLFEMLSGTLPFQGDWTDVTWAHRNQRPPSITEAAPHVPPEIGELIERMLQKSPEQRPDMATVAEALREILSTRTEFPAAALAAPPEDRPLAHTQTLATSSEDCALPSGPDEIGKTAPPAAALAARPADWPLAHTQSSATSSADQALPSGPGETSSHGRPPEAGADAADAASSVLPAPARRVHRAWVLGPAALLSLAVVAGALRLRSPAASGGAVGRREPAASSGSAPAATGPLPTPPQAARTDPGAASPSAPPRSPGGAAEPLLSEAARPPASAPGAPEVKRPAADSAQRKSKAARARAAGTGRPQPSYWKLDEASRKQLGLE